LPEGLSRRQSTGVDLWASVSKRDEGGCTSTGQFQHDCSDETLSNAMSQCSTADELPAAVGDLMVRGRVWLLSQDARGCRVVQEALESAASEEACVALVEELHGHVAKALRCPHANHVLQKCINMTSPEHSQFILDELLERPGLLAIATRHRYGCRVLQHLLQRCTQAQLQDVTELLMEDAIVFSCHPFGNYVMQRVLECGTEETQHRFVRLLEQNVDKVCGVPPGCNVIAAALSCGPFEDRVWLARAIVQEPSRVRALAQMRFGSFAAIQVLKVAGTSEQVRALERLEPQLESLPAAEHGHLLVECLAVH